MSLLERGDEPLRLGVDAGGRDTLEDVPERTHQQQHLLRLRIGLALRLTQQSHEPLSVEELLARELVQVARKLHEDLHLAVLRKVETQGPDRLFHRLRLRVAAHSGDGKTDVDGGALSLEKELALEEYLPVRDGDDIGGDIGGDVARLGLDDGKRGHAAPAELVGEVRRALQQSGMQIKDVAGISLAPGSALQKQAEGAVRHRVFAQVVIDDQDVLARIHEIFRKRAARIGGDILHGGGLPRARGEDDGVVEGTVAFQHIRKPHDGGGLLPYGDIDADDALALLIDDGVEGDGGLARLSVPDDELALTPADGEEGVHDEQPRLHGLVDGLTVDDAGSGTLDGTIAVRLDRTLVVHGLAERVDHSAEETVPYGDARGLARAVHGASRRDVAAVAEHDHARAVPPELLHHALHSALEDDDLAVSGVREPVHSGDAVADGKHSAALFGKHFGRPLVDRLSDERDDIALGKCERGEFVFELSQSAARAPIIDVSPDFQPEAAGIGGTAHPFKLRISVFFREKTHETRKLRVRGTGFGIKDRLNLCHLVFPFRQRRGIPHKPRPHCLRDRLFRRSCPLYRGCRRPPCRRCGHVL